MASRTGKLVKNTVILGFGQFLPRLLALITLPILTAALSTSDYGIYDLILSMESLIMPLMTLQIQQGIFRKIIQYGEKKASEIISTAYFFVLTSMLVWCPIIFCIFKFAVGYTSGVSITIYLFFVFCSLFDVFGQTSRGIGYNSKYSVGIVLYSVLNTIFLVLLYYTGKITIISVLGSSLVAYCISCIYYLISVKIYKQIDRKLYSRTELKDLLSYSVPMIPSSIALWIVNLSDRLLVTFFLGTSLNGIYAVANKIPNLFASVYSVFNLAWTETAARVMDKDKDADAYYEKMFDVLFGFLSGAMLLLISITPVLFRILINSKFDEAYQQIPILFMGVFFNCIVSFFGGIYVAKQQTKQVGYSSLAGAVINFVVNIAFIRNIGLYAASVATVVAFLIISIYRMIDVKKYVKICYNYRKISICMVAMIAYCFMAAQRNTILNIVLFILAIGFNLIINKEMINAVMNRVKKKK